MKSFATIASSLVPTYDLKEVSRGAFGSAFRCEFPLEVADDVDETALAAVMRSVPLGAAVLAGVAVALLVLGISADLSPRFHSARHGGLSHDRHPPRNARAADSRN